MELITEKNYIEHVKEILGDEVFIDKNKPWTVHVKNEQILSLINLNLGDIFNYISKYPNQAGINHGDEAMRILDKLTVFVVEAINDKIKNDKMNGAYLEEHEMKQLNELLEHDNTIDCWIATRINGASASLACEGNISMELLKMLDEKILPIIRK